jgi:hypothetical protein
MKIWIKKTQLIGRTAAKMVGMDCWKQALADCLAQAGFVQWHQLAHKIHQN